VFNTVVTTPTIDLTEALDKHPRPQQEVGYFGFLMVSTAHLRKKDLMGLKFQTFDEHLSFIKGV
jgi:hypothetical protein